MCTGLEIAALAASAAGAGAQNKANTDLLSRQNRQAEADVARNQSLTREAGRRVGQQIEDIKRSTPKAEENEVQTGFMDALRKSQIKGDGGLGGPGATSERFGDEAGIARTQGQQENARTANQLARIDAPMFQRQREARGFSDTATDLSLLQGRGQGQDFLSQLRMSMLRPNSGLVAGGQLLSGFGGAASGRMLPIKKNPQIPATGFTDQAIAAGVS